MVARVGLLGCGRIARLFHLRALASNPDAKLAAVADADPAALAAGQAAAPGARAHADWRAAIEAGGLDAVVICLPPALHAEAAVAAFRAGLHVYVEKPLALGTEEAERVAEAARLSGRVGAMGFNFRFHPNFRALRDRVAAGEFGEVLAIRACFASPRRAGPAWKGARESGGGALRDLATHHLDLVPFVAGAPIASASGRDRSFNVDGDVSAIDATLEGGAVVQLLATQAAAWAENGIELYCEAGRIAADAADPGPRRLERPPGRFARALRAAALLEQAAPWRLRRWGARDGSFDAALAAFVAAAAGKAPWSGATIEDGVTVVRLIDGIEGHRSQAAERVA